MTDITTLKMGDRVLLTGPAWAEIAEISPIEFAGIPQAGEEYLIEFRSVMGPGFWAYGSPWAVNDYYTADKVDNSLTAEAAIEKIKELLDTPSDERGITYWEWIDDGLGGDLGDLLRGILDRVENS